jgi:hypothetical protein
MGISMGIMLLDVGSLLNRPFLGDIGVSAMFFIFAGVPFVVTKGFRLHRFIVLLLYGFYSNACSFWRHRRRHRRSWIRE